MNIVFTDLFNKEFRDKLQINEASVKQSIITPEKQQTITVDELELRLYVKQMSNKGDRYYLLVCAHSDTGKLIVDSAFKILVDLVNEAKTLTPFSLLQQIALKFGLTIRIGQQLNEFIFRELIPIESLEPTKLVEVINPEKHSFIQSMFIKFEQSGEEKIANCALAYCIDSDSYLSWLTGRRSSGNVIIDIAPQLKGHLTPRNLIEANGTVAFWTNYSQLNEDKVGYLFKVVTENYHFEVGFATSCFYTFRNGLRLELPVFSHVNENVCCFAMWQPKELGLLMLGKSYDEAVNSGADPITETEKRTKKCTTPPTLPPNSLITWARKEAIIPTAAYGSLPDFWQEVILALQSIPDKARTANIYNAFWDITYKGALEIAPRKPKREPDIVSVVHGLLFDIAIAKTFELSPQYPLGGGELDFLISGHLKTGEIANVCVEFKHAHSNKLKRGLTKQLPKYMKTKGCDFGIYCVLFFKGKYFERPKNLDLHSLYLDLTALASSEGLSNVRILVFDLSYPIPPSQL